VTERREPSPFEVRFSPAAERDLRRLRPDDAARLRRPILSLAFDPRPQGSARIAGSPFHRLRSGDLRVVYLVRDRERVVIVVRIAKRSESTYRRLPKP
jgi:mRNA interferase RelE/StbE